MDKYLPLPLTYRRRLYRCLASILVHPQHIRYLSWPMQPSFLSNMGLKRSFETLWGLTVVSNLHMTTCCWWNRFNRPWTCAGTDLIQDTLFCCDNMMPRCLKAKIVLEHKILADVICTVVPQKFTWSLEFLIPKVLWWIFLTWTFWGCVSMLYECEECNLFWSWVWTVNVYLMWIILFELLFIRLKCSTCFSLLIK